jgi:hypothetical protein
MDSHEQVYIRNPKFRKPKEQEDDKSKKGVPLKYLSGAKNPKAKESEILRTRRLYKKGLLTTAMMDEISKKRARA